MNVGRSGAMELMLALFNIVQGTISMIMGSAGFVVGLPSGEESSEPVILF